MKRRELVLASAAWAALAAGRAHAQSAKPPRRIAFLSPSTEAFGKPLIGAFIARLKELGYVEGRDFVIDMRWAEGRSDRFAPLARELVGLNPAVIFASTSPAAAAAKQAAGTLPIVFISVVDPVAAGFVDSFARPGRNMTGMTYRAWAMVDKSLEMLREILPSARRVAILEQADIPNLEVALDLFRKRFAAHGLEVEFFPVGQAGEIDEVFTRIARSKPAAVYAGARPFFVSHARQIADLSLKARLPLIATRRPFVDAGGLLTYDNNLKDEYRRAAGYVDKILKGAKPADLPVEEPDLFEMVINLRTAKALGIKIPQSVLLRATEVIE